MKLLPALLQLRDCFRAQHSTHTYCITANVTALPLKGLLSFKSSQAVSLCVATSCFLGGFRKSRVSKRATGLAKQELILVSSEHLYPMSYLSLLFKSFLPVSERLICQGKGYHLSVLCCLYCGINVSPYHIDCVGSTALIVWDQRG